MFSCNLLCLISYSIFLGWWYYTLSWCHKTNISTHFHLILLHHVFSCFDNNLYSYLTAKYLFFWIGYLQLFQQMGWFTETCYCFKYHNTFTLFYHLFNNIRCWYQYRRNILEFFDLLCFLFVLWYFECILLFHIYAYYNINKN